MDVGKAVDERGVWRGAWVECGGLESGVDFLRGCWDGEAEVGVVALRTWNGRMVKGDGAGVEAVGRGGVGCLCGWGVEECA